MYKDFKEVKKKKNPSNCKQQTDHSIQTHNKTTLSHLQTSQISFTVLLLHPSFRSHESSLVANWRKFTSLATIPAIEPTHRYVPPILIQTGAFVIRDIYIGRAEGVHRLDRPFMKASWDKTLEGVPTPEGDDVLASKLPIVSWEKGRGSCWKVTWLR